MLFFGRKNFKKRNYKVNSVNTILEIDKSLQQTTTNIVNHKPHLLWDLFVVVSAQFSNYSMADLTSLANLLTA